MTIGTTLRKLRLLRRLSQREMADHLNVSQSTYSAWESDKSAPKSSKLPVLAELLQVAVAALLPAPEHAEAPPEESPAVKPLYLDLIASLKRTNELLEHENQYLRTALLGEPPEASRPA